jgi:hypothetical protein
MPRPWLRPSRTIALLLGTLVSLVVSGGGVVGAGPSTRVVSPIFPGTGAGGQTFGEGVAVAPTVTLPRRALDLGCDPVKPVPWVVAPSDNG